MGSKAKTVHSPPLEACWMLQHWPPFDRINLEKGVEFCFLGFFVKHLDFYGLTLTGETEL